jgi:hypothetical protein
MASVDEATVERAARVAWDAYRGRLGAPLTGVLAHPWDQLPKMHQEGMRSAVRTAFAVLDGATHEGLAEDGPTMPPATPPAGPSEVNSWDPDATAPGTTIDTGVPAPASGEGG